MCTSSNKALNRNATQRVTEPFWQLCVGSCRCEGGADIAVPSLAAGCSAFFRMQP